MAVVSNEERNINYDNFIDRLEIEVARAKRYERVVSLCIISIDGAGKKQEYDKAFLREFTRLVLEQARNVDISVTISTEEFGLILPETGYNNALQAANRIKTAIEGYNFGDENKEHKITVSIGVSAFPEHSNDSAELARRAMQAVSKATQSGGNRVVSASDI